MWLLVLLLSPFWGGVYPDLRIAPAPCPDSRAELDPSLLCAPLTPEKLAYPGPGAHPGVALHERVMQGAIMDLSFEYKKGGLYRVGQEEPLATLDSSLLALALAIDPAGPSLVLYVNGHTIPLPDPAEAVQSQGGMVFWASKSVGLRFNGVSADLKVSKNSNAVSFVDTYPENPKYLFRLLVRGKADFGFVVGPSGGRKNGFWVSKKASLLSIPQSPRSVLRHVAPFAAQPGLVKQGLVTSSEKVLVAVGFEDALHWHSLKGDSTWTLECSDVTCTFTLGDNPSHSFHLHRDRELLVASQGIGRVFWEFSLPSPPPCSPWAASGRTGPAPTGLYHEAGAPILSVASARNTVAIVPKSGPCRNGRLAGFPTSNGLLAAACEFPDGLVRNVLFNKDHVPALGHVSFPAVCFEKSCHPWDPIEMPNASFEEAGRVSLWLSPGVSLSNSCAGRSSNVTVAPEPSDAGWVIGVLVAAFALVIVVSLLAAAPLLRASEPQAAFGR